MGWKETGRGGGEKVWSKQVKWRQRLRIGRWRFRKKFDEQGWKVGGGPVVGG